MTIKFTKMHGSGNDFIMVNGFNTTLPENLETVAAQLCQRHFGIGADGLIILYPATDADFAMVIYNSDGSQAEMCGNGIRCAALFAYAQGIVSHKKLKVATKAGLKIPEISEDLTTITVDMGAPILKGDEIPCVIKGETVLEQPMEVAEQDYLFSGVSMGNPHCVIFINQPVNEFPVREIGPQIETHPYFPAKTNVEFIQVLDEHNIRMRVWERGCGETLACGTGACASAVAGILTNRCQSPVQVHLPGGVLTIAYTPGGNVFMTGSALQVYQGEIEIKL